MSVRSITLALIVVAVALTAVGCGDSSSGSGDSSSSTSSSEGGGNEGGGASASITKATFIKEADAACSKGQKEVETEFTAYLKKNNIKEIGEGGESKSEAEARMADVIEAAIPVLRQQLDEIRALGAPDGEEAKVNAYLDAAEEGIEKGEEDPQAMFSSTKTLFAASDKLAGEIGFKVCGQR